ncbi:unnamed protein product [Linum tenue]|uniref:Tryptophan synthase beta chain-like PALP domain-containing protein n=1 Tax=Linum tenue TaxID=586396 RepID=A0AAV0Q9P4_9ROSI|nr:unnamed protein product [Linum tenue]
MNLQSLSSGPAASTICNHRRKLTDLFSIKSPVGFSSAAMPLLLSSPNIHSQSRNLMVSRQIASDGGGDLVPKLLDRKWTLQKPESEVHRVHLSPSPRLFRRNPLLGGKLGAGNHTIHPSFYVVRDDLLHPTANGNKARKLDALIPLLLDNFVTDVITCGGCQSSHTAAVAVLCAERGMRSHLLLRGEQPQILTGYNLISTMYGHVSYVPRSVYADREAMLKGHADLLAGSHGHVLWCSDIAKASFADESKARWNNVGVGSEEDCARKVLIINEGAGDGVALIGLIRLVEYLSQDHVFGMEKPIRLVVDCGTGTTAIGLALGALCLRLPWKVTAIMLADTIDRYREKEKQLMSEFSSQYGYKLDISDDGGLVHWVQRHCPRKFGNILEGEMEKCQQIARQTGILVDPVYTLAAWEMAAQLSMEGEELVVMVHTGGTLGSFGLAQRYKSHFSSLK